MFYPEDFKKKCRSVNPKLVKLHEELENGSSIVGSYLKQLASQYFSAQDVLDATSFEELQAQAKSIKENSELYSEWDKLYEEQNKD